MNTKYSTQITHSYDDSSLEQVEQIVKLIAKFTSSKMNNCYWNRNNSNGFVEKSIFIELDFVDADSLSDFTRQFAKITKTAV